MNHSIKKGLIGFIAILSFSSMNLYADPPSLKDTLYGDPDGIEQVTSTVDEYGTGFGSIIDSDDQWVVVGAARQDVEFIGGGTIQNSQGEHDAGAVYIYKKTANGLVFHQRIDGLGNTRLHLYAQTGLGDRFGSGVELAGDQLFVSAAADMGPFDAVLGSLDKCRKKFPSCPFLGVLYVFNYDPETELWETTPAQTLTAPIPGGGYASRTFAKNFAVFENHNVLLVGEFNGSPGRVHVYKKQNGLWVPADNPTLLPQTQENIQFGFQVLEVGDDLVSVMSPDFDDPFESVVYIYRVNDDGIVSDTPVQKLTSASVSFGCNGALSYGIGSAASDGILAMGDPCDNSDLGSIQVWSYADDNGIDEPLTLVQTLSNPRSLPLYGSHWFLGQQSISVEGDKIIVGTAADFIIPEHPVDIYTFNEMTNSYVLSNSIENRLPVYGEDFFGTFTSIYGNAVHLDGDDLYISTLGWFGLGGPRVDIYDLSQ